MSMNTQKNLETALFSKILIIIYNVLFNTYYST